jgi:general stress protein CsbA
MCFSATASFTAATALAVAGSAGIIRSHTTPQRLFASVTMVFAIQQFAEGTLWLALMHPQWAAWRQVSTFVFLLCAQVIWPVLVPLSILLLEKSHARRKIMYILLASGAILSSYLLYRLLFHNVYAEISNMHIRYNFDLEPPLNWSSVVVYFVPTVLPALVSTVKRMRLLGFIVLMSYLVSNIFYQDYLVSVWCFFAAVISVVILYIIEGLRVPRSSQPSADPVV